MPKYNDQERNDYISYEIKRRVILLSGGFCYHCKKKATTASIDKKKIPAIYDEKGRRFNIDHLIPLCIGGSNEEKNLVISCQDCNFKKARQTFNSEKETQTFVDNINKTKKVEK